MPIMLIRQIKAPGLIIPIQTNDEPIRRSAWKQRLRTEFKRYVSLTPKADGRKNSSFTLIFNQFALNLMYMPLLGTQIIDFSGASGVTSIRLFAMLLWSVTTSNCLVVRDVHWRYLLLPGGLERRRLASNILLSTARLQGCILTMLAILAGMILVIFSPNTLSKITESLMNYWRLPIEWLAMLTLAIYIRSFQSYTIIILTTILAILGSYYQIYLPFIRNQHEQIVFPANEVYITSLIAFSMLMMYVNNRRWTTELLFEKLKSNSV